MWENLPINGCPRTYWIFQHRSFSKIIYRGSIFQNKNCQKRVGAFYELRQLRKAQYKGNFARNKFRRFGEKTMLVRIQSTEKQCCEDSEAVVEELLRHSLHKTRQKLLESHITVVNGNGNPIILNKRMGIPSHWMNKVQSKMIHRKWRKSLMIFVTTVVSDSDCCHT